MLQRVLVITKRKSIVASFQKRGVTTVNHGDPLRQSRGSTHDLSKDLDTRAQQKLRNAQGIAVKSQGEEYEKEKQKALNRTPPAPGNGDEVNKHFVEKEQHEAEEVQQHH